MQWRLQEENATARLWVLEEQQQLAVLLFNTQAKTIRLNALEKRLFFLESSRFL